MPNWTSNALHVEGAGQEIRAFVEAIKGKDTAFDFNRIIPMPELLQHTGSGGRTIDGQHVKEWYVIDKTANFPDDKQVRLFTPQEEAELQKIGHRSWYDWSCQNWGTKWNAAHAEIDDEGSIQHGYVRITYMTAWCEPLPVLQKLFEMFPHLSIRAEWRHEDESEYPHSLSHEPVKAKGAPA